jgi:hypothetical protein
MKKRYFNTSGPNIPESHYTIIRHKLLQKGEELVENDRYFTIWAPRQTGKSTYFRQLAEYLSKKDYQPVMISVEGFDDFSAENTFETLSRELRIQQNIHWQIRSFNEFEKIISDCNDKKLILIIDEIEGLNPAILGQFLHTVRNLYHSRQRHCLKSVILVGVSNVVGAIRDNASPFKITDHLNVPYFSNEEVFELLEQHELETNQLFDKRVKEKICEITANQPGLVNGFAKKLVEDYPEKPVLDYDDYLKTEDWYLRLAIDKNFENILNKANEERPFVERLLFTDEKIPFTIDRPSIRLLHVNGLIKDDGEGYVTFWVPFYKKRLFEAFYPYMNGEQQQISRTLLSSDFFNASGELILEKLIEHYKTYIRRRGFNPHREKDAAGNYKSIKEAALIYSFETYIHAVLSELGGKIYREANTGIGKSDMIINIANQEILIETKVYRSPGKFQKGKTQTAHYCRSLSISKGIYLVYCPAHIPYPDFVKEDTEVIDGVEINVFLIMYDEKNWQ